MLQSITSLLPKNTPVTLGVIAVCVIFYFSQGATQQAVTNWGLLYGPAVAAGEWWRVISSGFLHGGGLHLLVNMGLLLALGQQLEEAIGGSRFALVYAGSIAAGSLAVILFANNQPTLGASGAVMGVALAYAVVLMLYSRSNRHQSLLMLVGLNLAMPLLVPGISFWGHLGGAIGGLLLVAVVIVWPQQVRKRQIATGGVYSAERQPVAVPSLVAGGVAVLALFVFGIVLA